ncbi:MAG: hypothetical protein ACKVQT_02380 [Burkholderiales bacterium]
MRIEKVTLSLPNATLVAIDRYQRTHGLEGREEVIEIAMALLREHEREAERETEGAEDFDEPEEDLDVALEMGHGIDQDDDRW